MTENYREKWERLGLLAGLDNDVADKVALGFEQMKDDLLTCGPYVTYPLGSFEVIAFPMLCRIVTACPDFTYEKFKKYMKGIDFEGELIDALCDKIIAKEKDLVKEYSK